MIELIEGDCLEEMKQMKNNQFDLSIVDPPYFSDYAKKNYTGNDISTTGIKRQSSKIQHWEIPSQEYFDQLFRVSKNQIIWGCNYYSHYIPHTGRIVWYKKNLSSTFSKCEIASHSFGVRVDYFEYLWNGMLQENMKNKEKRIHPTQKPVQLYTWILNNYAKKGDKILDTHAGSASLAIACDNMNYDYLGIEIDSVFFRRAKERIKKHQSQLKLFT